MTDRRLQCVDCKQEFTFSVKDQGFYQQMNFSEPKRCKPCRERKKAVNAAAPAPTDRKANRGRA